MVTACGGSFLKYPIFHRKRVPTYGPREETSLPVVGEKKKDGEDGDDEGRIGRGKEIPSNFLIFYFSVLKTRFKITKLI